MNGHAATAPLLFNRYGQAELRAMFDGAGVLARVEERGFRDLAFELDASQGPLVHVQLFGSKAGDRFLLMDACLTEARIEAGGGTGFDAPVDLLVIYWLREQDPTADFDASRLRLPLQEHPGLGVLRRAFKVALCVARELGKHGIAALPKFFHDAAIFYRSRLFLFLDPVEQGRFEALLRDLSALSLQQATLALAGSAVLDDKGQVVCWRPGFQVMPLDPGLTAVFHDERYQAACRSAFERARFSVDPAVLATACEIYERSLTAAAQPGFASPIPGT
jgi:hypothetical protein